MTQEQKDILLKDLCARLPYGVKVEYENKVFDLEHVCPMYEEVKLDIPEAWTISVSEVKPYLFPLSSMTEEQKKELKVICDWCDDEKDAQSILVLYYNHCVMKSDVIDWFNKNHFDYRGLIPMGLAIDATNKDIY